MCAISSPLRWPGGKSRLAEWICRRMPEHATYAEPCAGAAWVFFRKPRGWSRAEIINDADGDLASFYRVLRRHGRRLLREVESMPYSREVFYRERDGRPSTQFRRAVRFWYLNRVAFGGIRSGGNPSFGVKAKARATVMPATVRGDLDAIAARLEGVLIEHVDVVRLIDLYDRPDTLFYIDPPYIEVSRGLYSCDFEMSDHVRLAARLATTRGAWLLSYDDSQPVRDLYSWAHMQRVELRYSIRGRPKDGRSRRGQELLLSNRPIAVCRPGPASSH